MRQGQRYLEHSPKTVVIVGMGPSITDMAGECLTQEFLPSWADEVWAINMAANWIWHDVVFWMDDLVQQDEFKPGLFTMLRRRNKPVITTKSYPDIVPSSYDYPIDEIGAMSIPIFGRVYLNNGVAQAVAYAIYKNVETIKLYGCDFSYPNRDYAESGRACVESWITIACIKNVQVKICDHSSLFDAIDKKAVYGYAEEPDIHLPDGKIWRAGSVVTATEPPALAYQPEDSSGQPVEADPNAIQRSLPRVDSPPANGSGEQPPRADDLTAPAENPTPRPSESVRD